MKKFFLFAMVAMMTMLCLTGCKDQQTPIGDKTKLWPAYSPSAKKFGFIDNKGNFKIAPNYDAVTSFFSCGFAMVRMNDNFYFIDKKGTVKFACPSDGSIGAYHYKYAVVRDGKYYGLLDTKQTYAIMPQYYTLGTMSENGLAIFRQSSSSNDKLGYVDANGKVVISAQYDYAEMFRHGSAVVGSGSNYGIIDTKGNFKVSPMYFDVDRVSDNCFAVWKNRDDEHPTLIDASGKTILTPSVFEYGYAFDNGLIPTWNESTEKMGYINEKGETKIPFSYREGYPFFQGYAWVYTNYDESTGDWMGALIDTKGNVQFQLANARPGLDDEVGMHNGLILLSVRNKDNYSMRWVDRKGNIVYQWSYENGRAPERKSRKAAHKEMPAEPYVALGF